MFSHFSAKQGNGKSWKLFATVTLMTVSAYWIWEMSLKLIVEEKQP